MFWTQSLRDCKLPAKNEGEAATSQQAQAHSRPSRCTQAMKPITSVGKITRLGEQHVLGTLSLFCPAM